MNSIVPWNPFREMEDLQSRLLNALNLNPVRRGEGQESITVTQWAPLVDITEDDANYIITAELPEVKKQDVKVTVENGVLTLTGERVLEKQENGLKYHRIERAYGSFARSFALPDDADATKVTAAFKDGVLKVQVAKAEAARPKQIEVKVS